MRRYGSSRPSKLKRRRRNAPAERTAAPDVAAAAGATGQSRTPPATCTSASIRHGPCSSPSHTGHSTGSSTARIRNSSANNDKLARFATDGMASSKSQKTPPFRQSPKRPQHGSENFSTENLEQKSPSLHGKALDSVLRREVSPVTSANTGAHLSSKEEKKPASDGTCHPEELIHRRVEPIVDNKESSLGRYERDVESGVGHNSNMNREPSSFDLVFDASSKENQMKMQSPFAILGLDELVDAEEMGNQQRRNRSSASTASGYIVHHPIIGDICVPVSEPRKPDREEAFDSIEFRPSLGLDECEISFPRRATFGKIDKSRYRMGDGLRVSLSSLSFPTVNKDHHEPKDNGMEKVSRTDLVNAAKKPFHVIEGSLGQSGDRKRSTVVTTTADADSGSVGMIRIVSERGATIREHYDIDEAQLSLGKLKRGDVRRFVKKEWLPAPAPYSDDSDDEEYLGVMRYMIVLSPKEDQPSDANGHKHVFGWISDRGRLASDRFTILEEQS